MNYKILNIINSDVDFERNPISTFLLRGRGDWDGTGVWRGRVGILT